MFSELHLTNFRSFKDSGRIPLRRLNILIGANSSGKSSLLYSFLLLKQTLEDPNPENFLVTNGRLVGMGGFDELAVGHSTPDGIGLRMSVSNRYFVEHSKRYAYFQSELGADDGFDFPTNLDLLFGCNKRNKQFYLKKFAVN